MLKSKLTKLTCYSVGLAVFFLMADGNIKLDAFALNVLDSALAVSVAVFFILIISTASVFGYALRENLTQENFIGPQQAGYLLLLAIVLVWTGGWLLFDFAASSSGAMRTATTLGASMLGVVVVYTYVVVIGFLTRKNTKKI